MTPTHFVAALAHIGKRIDAANASLSLVRENVVEMLDAKDPHVRELAGEILENLDEAGAALDLEK
jgi:hypothetical protein